ncbi:2-phosphosulfolactate phosphatase [Tautonia plasticadhaerens]|uniref:Probable 2-phosphosulfolactate phosphatase n=1 Tax=Tautonia plasticadhaerens TaxID=2527974 RepID=A0A518H882_9BACT|nr:2-phosphosulfolactate phosphatase [Tautonia plasticadhaerens]QDV37011.1 putative 2-phosphosulfolactate phosphatase [Tautonia plasticadhaerens]
MDSRPSIFVHLLPSLIPEGALGGGVAVVLDVLRATTVMVHALASGCEAIVPCLEIEEAEEVAASFPPGTAILAGERGGLPIPGFDLGNSPGDFHPEVCRGKTLVMTTTNGTRAILSSRAADRVLIGAFPNLGAIVGEVGVSRQDIHVVCAGTDGLVSFEDTMLAGCLVLELERGSGLSAGNDAALIARRCWEASGPGPGLASTLATGRGGRRVSGLGLGADIEAAGRVSRSDLVPELRPGPLRIVAAGATRGGRIG